MNYSTTGRPRRLTDRQIAEIKAWHKSKRTNGQMAAHYGISRTTLEYVIRGGQYKQGSPA